jgi:hypothetical protein
MFHITTNMASPPVSQASLTKNQQLLDLAMEHNVEYIDLPMSCSGVERRNSMEGTDMGE